MNNVQSFVARLGMSLPGEVVIAANAKEKTGAAAYGPGNWPLDIASMRYLNETAIRSHALLCSEKFRGQRFTRVGQDFIDEVKTDVETFIRELRNKCPARLNDPLEISENTGFVSGALSAKVIREMDRMIGRIIQNKVQRQPSCGKTLQATH